MKKLSTHHSNNWFQAIDWTWLVAGLSALAIVACLLWQWGEASWPREIGMAEEFVDTADGFRFSGNYEEKKTQLESLDSVQLEALRRRILKYEQLSDAQRSHVDLIHKQLNEHPDGAELRAVMQRYYRWLKVLDEKSRRELLDLKPADRIARICELRQQQNEESFGRVGASKLPDKDANWVYEWTMLMVESKRDRIDQLLDSDEIKERLPDTIRSLVSKPAITARRSNYRFRLLVEHAPEYARALAFEDFEKLRKGLSVDSLKIIDAYSGEEQQQLILQWFKQASDENNRVTDEKLYQFWLSLPEGTRELLDKLSPAEWRRVLNKRYLHSLKSKARPPSDISRNPKKNSRRPAL